MSRVTMTKLGRRFSVETKMVKLELPDESPKSTAAVPGGVAVVGKKPEPTMVKRVIVTEKEKVDPAEKRQPITFTYGGVEITEMVAPGQVINKQKAYKRWLKAQGRSW